MFNRKDFDLQLKKLDVFAQAGYHLAIHIRFSSPLMHLQTYDAAWVKRYTENGYVLRDPVVAWAFASKGATRWSNTPIPDPFGIMKESQKFGLKYGVTVSIGPLSSRTVANVARSDREHTDDEILEIERIVQVMHEMVEPTAELTKAQLAALRLLANGDRQAAAAAKLGISESALKLRLSSARERLMARTTAEAVQRAKEYKLI